MTTFNPDTYCGIYCGACSVAMYSKTGCADEFFSCLGSVPKDELSCDGCKSDTVYYGCRICSLRSCAREKNVEHCIDCSDYPCKNYKSWKRAAKFLPHIQEAADSLETIKRDGADNWLDLQQKRWSCPDCDTSFSWYASMCSKCGRSLLSKAYKLSGWRRIFCQFVLPMMYRKGKAKNMSV